MDNDSKAILNGINLRLNDIDLKLSFVLELLANRLPEKSSREQLKTVQLLQPQLHETMCERKSISSGRSSFTGSKEQQQPAVERTSTFAVEDAIGEIAFGNTVPSLQLDNSEKSGQRQQDDILPETSSISTKGRLVAGVTATNDSEGDEEVDDYDDELDEVF